MIKWSIMRKRKKAGNLLLVDQEGANCEGRENCSMS